MFILELREGLQWKSFVEYYGTKIAAESLT
jgi:hypothetical protein